jgi:ABC-type maltose transport system permease subunit
MAHDLFRPVYFVQHPTLDNFKFVLFQQSPSVKYFWRWLANSLPVSGAVMVAVLAYIFRRYLTHGLVSGAVQGT